MANTNDNTPHDRANEKSKSKLTFEPCPLIPSLQAQYILKPGSSFDNLLADSSYLLGCGLALIKHISDDQCDAKAEGVSYLIEAAHTTLLQGHSLALEEQTIRCAPDGFYVGPDLIIEHVQSGNGLGAIQVANTLKSRMSELEETL